MTNMIIAIAIDTFCFMIIYIGIDTNVICLICNDYGIYHVYFKITKQIQQTATRYCF